MPAPVNADFRLITEKLLQFALRRGVPFEDAQDLVQAVIASALNTFDGGRGTMHAFCLTVLANRVKNYWRDRKQGEPVEIEEIADAETPDPVTTQEEVSRMKNMIARIEKELNPEESQFLKALGKIFEEMDSRAVSEAARSLRIEPSKGWDIFRRIQRKANALYPGIRRIEEPVSARAAGKPARSRISGKKIAPPAPPPAPGERPDDFVEAYSSINALQTAPVGFRGSFQLVRDEREPRIPTVCDIARFAAHEAWRSGILKDLTPRQASRFRELFS